MIAQNEIDVKRETEQQDETPQSPYQQALAYYHCDHEESAVRYKVYSNGTKHYFEQCLHCGRSVSTAIAHKDIPDIDECSEWDDPLEYGYRFLTDEMANRLRHEQQELWRNRNTEWDCKYREYLKSKQWQDKRSRVLKRDNHRCQACLKRQASQVHHKTYKYPLGQEPLFELVSVCNLCHDAITDLTGRGGGAR